MDFDEFIKIGRQFTVQGMPDTYEIIHFDATKIVVTIVGKNAGPLEIDAMDAKDALAIGLWVPIEKEQTTILDGMNCAKCKKFYQYAAPNQDDGTMICWSCRNGF